MIYFLRLTNAQIINSGGLHGKGERDDVPRP